MAKEYFYGQTSFAEFMVYIFSVVRGIYSCVAANDFRKMTLCNKARHLFVVNETLIKSEVQEMYRRFVFYSDTTEQYKTTII